MVTSRFVPLLSLSHCVIYLLLPERPDSKYKHNNNNANTLKSLFCVTRGDFAFTVTNGGGGGGAAR